MLAFGVVAPAAAGSFEDGVTAESRGEQQAAISAYREAAQGGEAAAEFALGRIYRAGTGAPQDYPGALAWFQKAAAQGNPGAEYELGLMYDNGEGTKRDASAAAGWFLKSATQGYAPAQISLAGMLERGAGVAKDFPQAIRWVTPEAEHGNVDAQLKLGTLYVEAARQVPHAGAVLTSGQFHRLMDETFGPGNWRETGGYRTPAREDELRAEGAGTVAAGMLSRHSLGTPGAPGAYDVVVANMSAGQAAARLLSSGARFRQVFQEGAHGSQGPHLHVEPLAGGARESVTAATLGDGFIDEAFSAALPDDLLSVASDYEHAEHWLQLAAKNGSVEAQTLLSTIKANGSRRRQSNDARG